MNIISKFVIWVENGVIKVYTPTTLWRTNGYSKNIDVNIDGVQIITKEDYLTIKWC